MPYVLDTDHVSLLLGGHPGVTRRVAAHPPVELYVTVVTAQELLDGWLPCGRGSSRWGATSGPMRA